MVNIDAGGLVVICPQAVNVYAQNVKLKYNSTIFLQSTVVNILPVKNKQAVQIFSTESVLFIQRATRLIEAVFHLV